MIKNDYILLTTKELQKVLKFKNINTVYRYLRSGKLKGSKIGREWRVRLEDIDRVFNRERCK